MSLHTSGPWEAATSGDYDLNGIGVFGKNAANKRFYIATAHYMGTAPEMGAEHNARLIAAAPELVKALEDLLPIAARSIQGTTDGEPLLEAACAALRKARGET